MKSQEQQVAQHLLQIKAIKLSPQNPFIWASGRRSPIYCDNRISLSHPETRRFLVEELVAQSSKFGAIYGIAGVATAGIPHGALLADRLNLPFIYVRSKAKAHGRKNKIEGELHPSERYLVVEDLISTGGSSLLAVDALREADAEVAGVMALFSYGFAEAEKAFAAAKCPFLTLSNYDALLREALAEGYIDEGQQQLLAEWRKDPLAWSNQFLSRQ